MCRRVHLEIFELLHDLMNLKLDFVGSTLTISQSLLHWVLFYGLAVNHLSILLNSLEQGEGINNQLATDFLEFVKLLVVLLLVFLCPGSSLL